MIKIIGANINHADLLVHIGKTTFLESHGLSAPKVDIDAYINLKFNESTFLEELQDLNNHFYILYYHEKAIGYSKIIYDYPSEAIPFKNVTKLERLYVLKEFHHLKLGLELFNFNMQLSLNNQQKGMWLFVWTENERAINFYKKAGFKIIGRHDFKISETHYNPNHQMLLTYQIKNITL